MSSFLPVLIIALIIFIGLFLVFGGNFVYTPSKEPSRYLPADRTIEFKNFEVYYTSSEEKIGYISGEVSNGLFLREDKKIGFQTKTPEEASEAFVELKVWSSNYYGRMAILVNGKEIYVDYPPIGEKLIGFDTSILKKDNILEVKAESSAWRIWAPTVYVFDLNADINYLGKRTKSFTFELSDIETEYMDKTRIVVFGERKGVGNLDVMINGVKIYSGVTTAYKDFPTSSLRTGNNTIEFSTEPNTRYDISSAQVIVIFK